MYIGLLDTNIHFTTVHAACDKKFKIYPIGNILQRYENILIPEEGRTMWHLKEAIQATTFAPIAPHSVISGTCEQMRLRYPQEYFHSNQKNPDVCQHYAKATFTYKGNLGIDYKNIMGRTVVNGHSQVLIGSYERYTDIMAMYEITLLAAHNLKDIKLLLDEFRVLAKNNDWHGQVLMLASNIHKFPERLLPPLYTKDKIPLNTFNMETQAKIIAAKKRLRFNSKRAYELNIPEDNFNESDVQQLLAA